jgi:hypothetical protein
VPDGPGAAGRLLLAPAGAAAVVAQVQVVGPDGPVDLGEDAVTVVPGGGVRVVDLAGLPPGRYAVHVRADAPVLASATWQGSREGAPLEGLTGVPSDRAWVQAVPPLSADGALVSLDAIASLDALRSTVVDVVAGPAEPVRGRLELLDDAGDVLADQELAGPAGARAGTGLEVGLAGLLDQVDGGAVPRVLRVVPDGARLHLALRVTVDDEDGPLVAAASVPGAPPAPLVVRLVPLGLPVLDAGAAGQVGQPGS